MGGFLAFLVWASLMVLAVVIGSKRTIGALPTFLWSFFLTPIIGVIIAMCVTLHLKIKSLKKKAWNIKVR